MKTIEEKYKRLTDVEHCLKRPGRYIGAIKPHTADTWTIDRVIHKMQKQNLTWNPGLIKLFDEVISNAVDHSKRPEGKHLDTIKVEVNRATSEISVWDNGGIPVIEHKEYSEYVPTLIFGYLRSGSNFDDTEDSTGTGQNGEGASLTNIFSTSFTVETCDGKKKFKQTWTKNMMDKTQPKITDGDRGFTKITFTPDYAHLGTQLDDGNYAKIIKRVYDIAGCNPRLKIYLDGERIQIKSFKDYVAMYCEEYEYDENEHWQVAIAHSDEGFQHVSFVNTTETVIGGSHVWHVSLQVCNKLREAIQKKYKVDVKPSEIQGHIRLFINATVVRPRYDSQTKENLITEVKEFKTSWEASDKLISRIMKSHIIQSVLDWVQAKAKAAELARLRELNKDVEKANVKRIDKFSDALESVDRHLCELYLTEGDCLEENTEIIAARDGILGKRKIGDVKCGDLVLTHTGKLQEVTQVAYSVKAAVKIKTALGDLLLSREHRLLVYDVQDKDFKWMRVGDLIPEIHKLTKSTLVDVVHAEVVEIEKLSDCTLSIKYSLGGEVEEYISTPSHQFHVFDVDSLSYSMVQADLLIENRHFLTFRYKYDVYDGRDYDENQDHK